MTTKDVNSDSAIVEFTNPNKDVKGRHRFYLVRNDGAKPYPEYIEFESVPYPDPIIQYINNTTTTIKIRVDKLQYRTSIGGEIKYEYFDSSGSKRGDTNITVNEITKELDIPIKSYNSSIAGTHKFTLTRNGDNKTVVLSHPIDHISIDSVTYDATSNLATVNVSGLYGSSATLKYIARNKRGKSLQTITLSIPAGSTQVTFTPKYVPAKYEFELTCGVLKTTRYDPNDLFLPLVNANMHRDKVVFGLINDRVVNVNTTYIFGDNREGAISIDGSLNWFQDNVSFNSQNSIIYTYDYRNATQKGKKLVIGIKANGYELIGNYNPRKEYDNSEIDSNGNYKIEELKLQVK